ncbi:hypothetical protein COO91_08389 [Nostoc flagelliforme CCNUN1]|uniref:HEPN AbiU2-like domain-containing protein n=1 Tax=Nostoc flagelliforme CCNUN1 TaxID=2038116 RepID=A0A2K8T3J2_9NOSO|nr:hypothetical protein [Nostoc flagelliforme]AUB42272.1 hypothetical protein COO91_08389 [Nostoc flagelliforme CCNUN1]
MYTPKEHLQDIVNNGIKFDLLAAETAIVLYETIGNYQSELADKNFEHLFGTIQLLLAKDIVLSISKIFDHNDRFSLRSLYAAIKIINNNSHELKIQYRIQLEEKLGIWGLDRKCLIAMTDSELTTIVAKVLNDKMPFKDDMKAIKNIRDKRLAHDESIDEAKISVIMWQELDNLVELAKSILGIIGNHYLGSLYEINGEYTLSEDALIESRSLVRLFKQAGIIS